MLSKIKGQLHKKENFTKHRNRIKSAMELGHTAILGFVDGLPGFEPIAIRVTTSLDLNQTTIQHGPVLFDRRFLRTKLIRKYFQL